MRVTPNFCAGLTVLLAIAHSAIAKLVEPDQKLPDCISGQKFSDIGDHWAMGKFWSDSGAEQYADAYIKANGDHSQWVQNLYRELFPEANHIDMSCITTGAKCEFNKECHEFNAIGKGGLWYLFVSLQNFNTYMVELRARFNEASFLSSLKISSMKEDLKIPETDDAKVNVAGVFAGALSMVSGAAVGNPAMSGGLAALSGIMTLVSLKTDDKGPSLSGKSTQAMEAIIQSVASETLAMMDMIIAAVYGSQGHKQDDIPVEMRLGGVENPAVSIFGWGAWLKDNPTQDMQQWFKNSEAHMAQGLIWTMARMFKGTYVIIRDDMGEGVCTGENNAWDGDKRWCQDVLIWNQKSVWDSNRYFAGAKDWNGMFAKYNMDKSKVLKNAVECWESNNGNMGPTLPHAKIFENDNYPPCFFRQTVRKGSWNSDMGGYLEKFDTSFPGQTSGFSEGFWP